jgi:hypothetical protein
MYIWRQFSASEKLENSRMAVKLGTSKSSNLGFSVLWFFGNTDLSEVIEDSHGA